MKTVILFVVLLVLGGCGDPNYQEQPLPTKTCIFQLASTSFSNYSTNH